MKTPIIVWGDGPVPCDLMFVGEAPGREEIAADPPRPFIGKAGRELDRFLDGESLPARDQIYVTNACKALPVKGKPNAEEIATWRSTLEDELEVVCPKVVVALGATALQWFVPGASIERLHGLQVSCSQSFVLFATYHPAAALHAPDLQSHLSADFEALAIGLRQGFGGARVDTTSEHYVPLPAGLHIPRRFSIDTEGSADAPWCLTISWKPGHAYFVTPDAQRGLAHVCAVANRARRVTCQGLLHDLDVLAAMGITIPEAAYDDTQIMAYVLGLEPLGLKDLAYRHLGAEQAEYADVIQDADNAKIKRYLAHVALLPSTHARMSKAARRVLTKIEAGDPRPARKVWAGSKFSKAATPVPVATLDDVPAPVAQRYACRDADLTERLRPILWKKIQERKLEQVYKLDLSVLPIVNRMRHAGMQIDRERFHGLIERFDLEYIENAKAIRACLGYELNPNSWPQVSALLYDDLGLLGVKRTRSGSYSTQDKYLEALQHAHPIVPLIIDGRQIVKMQSFVAAVLEYAQEAGHDWFLYPHLRITRVVSGRVSAFDPNVLGLPKHSARGKLIRNGFIAGSGHMLLSHDLSQIDMRVMAHESRDPYLLKIYREGRDVHADLGQKIFGIPPEQQDESLHRLPMKKLNFGDLMGMTAKGVWEQLRAAGVTAYSVDDCTRFLREQARLRPGVEDYKAAKHAQARRYGYVTDLLGRRRHLAGVHAADKWIRLEALRQAQATPIQAGAQEVFKTWMAAVWTHVIRLAHKNAKGVYCEPWLQVHDDLIVETDEAIVNSVARRVTACLPQMLCVPVVANAKSAEHWGAL